MCNISAILLVYIAVRVTVRHSAIPFSSKAFKPTREMIWNTVQIKQTLFNILGLSIVIYLPSTVTLVSCIFIIPENIIWEHVYKSDKEYGNDISVQVIAEM